jgi:hypothetical protein
VLHCFLLRTPDASTNQGAALLDFSSLTSESRLPLVLHFTASAVWSCPVFTSKMITSHTHILSRIHRAIVPFPSAFSLSSFPSSESRLVACLALRWASVHRAQSHLVLSGAATTSLVICKLRGRPAVPPSSNNTPLRTIFRANRFKRMKSLLRVAVSASADRQREMLVAGEHEERGRRRMQCRVGLTGNMQPRKTKVAGGSDHSQEAGTRTSVSAS